MKINYTLDQNNKIISYVSFPLDTTKPIIDTKDEEVYLGISEVINGVFYSRSYKQTIIKDSKEELAQIKKWLAENDWKVNKIVVGEWSTSDSRWLDYLAERKIKRDRQDYLKELINGNN